MPKNINYNKVLGMVAAVAAGYMGYNYYYKKPPVSTIKTEYRPPANSDNLRTPVIQHAMTPDKTRSALEDTLNNPSKNASNRIHS
jgi:hypothetical protein